MMMNTENKFYRETLFHENNCYEDEDVDIRISSDEIVLREITSEHAPGGMYGLRHELDQENTERFIRSLGLSLDCNPAEIAKKFRGRGAESRFKDHCREHSIKYVSYLI